MNNYQSMLLRIIASLLFGCSVTFAQDQSGAVTSEPSNSTDISQPQSGSSQRDYELTAEFYRSIVGPQQPDIAKLNLFFTRMPKGGDLHNHYSGSIYAETYLDWVQKKGWLIDECTLQIVKTESEGSCKQLTVPFLKSDASAYRKLLSLWSDKDFGNHIHMTPPPDQKFFNTFGFFGPIADDFIPTGLRILKQRALTENVGYIETMLSQVGVNNDQYFTSDEREIFNQKLTNALSQGDTDLVLEQIVERLDSKEEFISTVDRFVDSVQRNHQGMDDEDFMMRYQTYAVRVLDPLSVFADLLSGYMAAERSPLVVGVNIVAPENNTIALRDYTLHMRMYNYLLRKYPNVNRALHAGELTLGMVRPKNLNFHIRQALEIAQAQRIGHGVDLPYENDSVGLLAALRSSSVIEINLTSNQFILGVEGNQHPYLIYASYGVPLVISTDDSGVSRNNLSNEYMLLASRYQPAYARIKEYVYNSIKHSFLDEENKQIKIAQLDREFEEFEQEMSQFYGQMSGGAN